MIDKYPYVSAKFNMPKVTQVEPQKKNPSHFNIYIDGVFAFGANEDLVVNYRLIVGKEVTQKELGKLLFESEVGKLVDRMYNLFSIRQRSEKEVRDYIKRLSFKRKIKTGQEVSDLVIDNLIDKLKQKGLINDLDFAKSWIKSRRKSKQKGIRALKIELIQKGINKEIIETVLESNNTKEGELAKKALEKKLKQWKSLSALEFKKKAYDFLLRKGFEYQIVKNTVENFLKKG